MATPPKRLGRGLGNLIASGGSQKPAPATPAAPPPAPTAPEVPVAAIDANPFQPRREFDPAALRELADSIRAEGLLQPVLVRATDNGRYQLVAGERRWRAFQLLGLKSIPARVVKVSDASSASAALIENLQRADLNPLEEAEGYATLVQSFSLTQEQVAERVGRSRAAVANALRLLNLPEDIHALLARGQLSAGHGKALLTLDGDDDRRLAARRIVEEGLNVRQAEALVAGWRKPGAGKRAQRSVSPVELAAISDLEKRLASHLQTRVVVRHRARKGHVVIEYRGNADLQRLLERLGVKE